ncbi:DRG2, partial [Hepatospora eriocheir]
MGISDKIADVENEIARTQKNKATEHHLGILKAKPAKLKAELDLPKGAAVKGKGWEISKSGDGRACLIGF